MKVFTDCNTHQISVILLLWQIATITVFVLYICNSFFSMETSLNLTKCNLVFSSANATVMKKLFRGQEVNDSIIHERLLWLTGSIVSSTPWQKTKQLRLHQRHDHILIETPHAEIFKCCSLIKRDDLNIWWNFFVCFYTTSITCSQTPVFPQTTSEAVM